MRLLYWFVSLGLVVFEGASGPEFISLTANNDIAHSVSTPIRQFGRMAPPFEVAAPCGIGYRLAPATKVATMYVACRSRDPRARS